MSDAQGVSDQSDTVPVAANPTAAPTSERTHRGLLIRVLATAGALVFAYVMWVPWAIIVTMVGDKATVPQLIDPSVAFAMNLAKVGDLSPTPFVVAAFSVLGLLLAPLLWRPAGSLLGAIASHIFGLWIIFATVFIIAFGLSPLVSGNPQPLLHPYSIGSGSLITYTGKIALGFWVAAAALIPMWIAVIGLLFGEWRRHAFWHLPGNDTDAPRSLMQLPGAGALNLGLLIWAWGFLSAGWASLNCNQSPLFFSSCTGTPASGALFAGLAQATRGILISSAYDPRILVLLDPNIARNAVGILLGVGALLIFLGVWLRAVTRAFCVWTTLWLALAVALAGVAYTGVSAIVAHPTFYGFAAGVWRGESGIWITLLGLILAVAGLSILSFAALRRRME